MRFEVISVGIDNNNKNNTLVFGAQGSVIGGNNSLCMTGMRINKDSIPGTIWITPDDIATISEKQTVAGTSAAKDIESNINSFLKINNES